MLAKNFNDNKLYNVLHATLFGVTCVAVEKSHRIDSGGKQVRNLEAD